VKIISIIHGRMTSSRLPGKVMLPLAGKSVFYHHVERMRSCRHSIEIYLGTANYLDNKLLVEEAESLEIPYYCGAEDDVVERYTHIGEMVGADAIVRCGCDKPLFSIEVVDSLIAEYHGEDYLYVADTLGKGVTSEIISLKALIHTHQYYRGPAISLYINENPHLFKTRSIHVDGQIIRPEYRLAIDAPEDYKLISLIYEHLYDGKAIPLKEVYSFLDDNPEIAKINRNVQESNVNIYMEKLKEAPVFSVFQTEGGKFLVKDRNGNYVGYSSFSELLRDRTIWAN